MNKSDFLYGVEYKPEPVTCVCGSERIYILSATEHYLCLECGKQWKDENEC
mgnify:CR=1